MKYSGRDGGREFRRVERVAAWPQLLMNLPPAMERLQRALPLHRIQEEGWER